MSALRAIDSVATLRARIRAHRLIGLSTGILAGMGAFMYVNDGLLPPGVPDWAPVVVLCLAGAYTVILPSSLSRSIRALLIAFATAVGVLTVASILPVWVLSYTAGSVDIALIFFLRQAIRGTLMGLLVIFLGSYFVVLIVAGYLSW